MRPVSTATHEPTPLLVTPAKSTGCECHKPRGGATLLLAHGAGAPMDSPFLEAMAQLISQRGITVARFEFAYMAARRTGGKKRPPPKAELLCDEYLQAVDAASGTGAVRLLVGGKSMGGRVASLVARELHAAGRIAGLVCLGYPFHPVRAPQSVRTAHLADLACPTLIVQGDEDPLGTRAQVERYDLSRAIGVHWIAGGDHDLAPKARAGTTKAEARAAVLARTADAIVAFAARL